MYDGVIILTSNMYDKGGENVAYKQEWHRETKDTYNTSARVPKDLHADVKHYAEQAGVTITDVVVAALKEFLSKRGYNY